MMRAMTPMHFMTDEETLSAALKSLGGIDEDSARVLVIDNTLDLSRIEFSAALLDRGPVDIPYHYRGGRTPDAVCRRKTGREVQQMIPPAVIREIARVVGEDNIFVSLEERMCYGYDGTPDAFVPDLVARPGSTEEIQAIVRLANKYLFPIIPRGAGTGLSGGSLPVQNGVVLDLTRMNRILEIDEENLVAVTEPGVVTYTLQQEVERRGLFYPPDPASLKTSTIGGNVAECAGGPRAFKYGVTRDYVLGLEVVTPQGDLVKTGGKTIKSVTGYDLTRLVHRLRGNAGHHHQDLPAPDPQAAVDQDDDGSLSPARRRHPDRDPAWSGGGSSRSPWN